MECCNAPRPMCQVSSSYSLLFALSLLACHALHIMSSCAFHLHTCSSHASERFPGCPFCILALRSPPMVISTFFSCVGIKHFRIGPILAKRPWYTTRRPPVNFIPFGLRLMLQWLTEGPKRPRVCCSPTPLHFGPKPTKTHSII